MRKVKLNKLNRYQTIIVGDQAFDIYKSNSSVYLTNCGKVDTIVATFDTSFFDYIISCSVEGRKLMSSDGRIISDILILKGESSYVTDRKISTYF